ncbi:hypothetical protein CL653_03170 [bacterium]|nr:hypothetical protein [bacterium]
MKNEPLDTRLIKTFADINQKLIPKRASIGYIRKNGLDDLYDELIEVTSFLNDDPNVTIGKRIRTVIEGYSNCPVCEASHCDNVVSLRPGGKLFPQYCSKKCASIATRDKVKETNLERWGHTNPIHNPEINARVRSTIRNKLGVDHPAQSQIALDKMKETNLERYGVPFASQNEEVWERVQNTRIEKYGTQNLMEVPAIREKIRETNLERFGVEHIFQSSDIKDKIRKSVLERYGVSNVAKADVVKAKTAATNLLRYGVENYSQSNAFKENLPEPYWKQEAKQIAKVIKEGISSKDLVDLLGLITRSPLYSYILPELGFSSTDLINDWATSQGETELVEFIKEIYDGNVVTKHKLANRFEIDVYIPDLNLGFEFNGCYWHSHKLKNADYHQKKTTLCEESGIHLFHIYEYEWMHKRDGVLELIRNKLSENRIYIGARECEVYIPSPTEAREFFAEHHFDGHRPAGEYYGIRRKNSNEPVMMASFTFDTKTSSYELIRLASSCRVVGGLKKILKYAGYDHVKSFANRGRTYRYENIYIKTGFDEVRTTPPNYVYFKNGTVVSRYQAMKHNLPKLLGVKFDPSKTEKSNMIDNGWLMIHDSGQLLYEWRSEQHA